MSFPKLNDFFLDQVFEGLLSKRVDNYVIPGLRSGVLTPQGARVRIFHQTTHQTTSIVPHSHRFDLLSIVLTGTVRNTLWQYSRRGRYGGAQPMAERTMHYDGVMGQYVAGKTEVSHFTTDTRQYEAGEHYRMGHNEIHSIQFSAGAVVLLIESPQRSNDNVILLPLNADGSVIEAFDTQPWMFQKFGE